MRVLRAGTRGSDLALYQTKQIATALEAADPQLKVEPIIITTSGDRITDRSLADAGGKGLFVRELESSLIQGKIDFAVHSGKDLPAVLPEPFTIAAVSERGDPSDLLISLPGHEISVVGTASPRRALIMQSLYPGCQIKLLRGNVPTRIQKLRDGQYDAIVLAAAGINRLKINLSEFQVRKFSPKEMVPAACQGILACETVKNSEAERVLSLIDHRKVRNSFLAERRLMQLLGADCHDAVGVYSEISRGQVHMCAFFQTPVIRETGFPVERAEDELKSFAEELKR